MLAGGLCADRLAWEDEGRSMPSVKTFPWGADPALQVRTWTHQGRPWVGGEGEHAEFELGFVLDGRLSYRVGRDETLVQPGAVMLIPPRTPHITGFPAPALAGSLCISTKLVSECLDVYAPRARLQPGISGASAKLYALAHRIAAEVSGASPDAGLAVEALTEAAIIMLARAPTPLGAHRKAADPRIRVALDAIASHYANPLTVEELARTVGMSRFHFSRLFREQVGRSPYQHLLATRLDSAARLLRARECNVTEAALTVGFQDLSRFSQAFRRHLGCSPNQLLREDQPSARSA
jgi:AraC family transcriptional regulator